MRTSESESEILLGNKQLLGIFFVVALLLAVAFYGGYMVGRGGSAKRAVANGAASQEEAAAPAASSSGGETHEVPAGSSVATEANGSSGAAATSERPSPTQEPLGTRKRKAPARSESSETEASGSSAGEGFAPQVGEQFLQVAAVSRDDAEAVADVLHKKGFKAHAVPKPGNPKIYRVIVGPIRDTADLSSTRDALVRTGFREVILQKY